MAPHFIHFISGYFHFNFAHQARYLRQATTSAFLVITSTVIAFLVEDLNAVIDLAGAFGGGATAFILPVLAYTSTTCGRFDIISRPSRAFFLALPGWPSDWLSGSRSDRRWGLEVGVGGRGWRWGLEVVGVTVGLALGVAVLQLPHTQSPHC